MSKQSSRSRGNFWSQRAQNRRPKAAHYARERKAGRPFQQFRQRIRDAVSAGQLHSCCVKIADALCERWEENGHHDKLLPVYIGYGPVKTWERQHHRPGVLPPLSVLTGLDRRTVMRGIRQMVDGGYLFRQYGDGLPPDPDRKRNGHPYRTGGDTQTVWVFPHRQRYREAGKVKYRPLKAFGERQPHTIGTGGCDEGGLGIANCYWVDGMPGPQPDPDTPPAPAPEPPPAPEPDGPPIEPGSWKPLGDRIGPRPGPRARGP